MRLYQTARGSWAGTQADAKRLAVGDGSLGEFRQVEVPTDKPGLLAWLGSQRLGAALLGTSAPIAAGSHADVLLAFEDEWEGFPLARKLHFAALALEEARERVGPALVKEGIPHGQSH